MTQEEQKKEKKDNQMTIISIVSLTIVLAFITEIYEIINDPQNLVVIGSLGAFILVAVYAETMLIHRLNVKKKKEQDEAYRNVYRSEKATFLLMKKHFEQMDQKMEELEQKAGIPYEKLVAAQKALAKVQINRNKENTSVMMHSNKAALIQGNRDIIAKQEQILSGLKELEDSIKSEILESANKIAQMKEEQKALVLEMQNQYELSRKEEQAFYQSYLDNLTEQRRLDTDGQSLLGVSWEDNESPENALQIEDGLNDGLNNDLNKDLKNSEDFDTAAPDIPSMDLSDMDLSAGDGVSDTIGDLPLIEETVEEPATVIPELDLPPIGEELPGEMSGMPEMPLDLPPIGEEPAEEPVMEIPDLPPDLPPIGEEPSEEPVMEMPEMALDLPPIAEEPATDIPLMALDLPPIGEESSEEPVMEIPDLALDLPPIGEAMLPETEHMPDLPPIEEPVIKPLEGILETETALPPLGEDTLPSGQGEMFTELPPLGEESGSESADTLPDLPSDLMMDLPPIEDDVVIMPLDMDQPEAVPAEEEPDMDSLGPLEDGFPMDGEELSFAEPDQLMDLPPLTEEKESLPTGGETQRDHNNQPAVQPFAKSAGIESEFPPLSKESAIESLKAKSALRKKEMSARQADTVSEDISPMSSMIQTDLPESEMSAPVVEEAETGASEGNTDVVQMQEDAQPEVKHEEPEIPSTLPVLDEQPLPFTENSDLAGLMDTESENTSFSSISSSELGIDPELQALLDKMELEEEEDKSLSGISHSAGELQPQPLPKTEPVIADPVIKPLGFDLSPQPLTEQSAIRKLAKNTKTDLPDPARVTTSDEAVTTSTESGAQPVEMKDPAAGDTALLQEETVADESDALPEEAEIAESATTGEESIPFRPEEAIMNADLPLEEPDMAVPVNMPEEPDMAVPVSMPEEPEVMEIAEPVSKAEEADTTPDAEAGIIESDIIESDTAEPVSMPAETYPVEPVAMPEEPEIAEPVKIADEMNPIEVLTFPGETDPVENAVIPEEPEVAETLTIPEEPEIAETLTIPEEADVTDSGILKEPERITGAGTVQESPLTDKKEQSIAASDPGHVMSADEIAALIANTDSLSDPEPIDLRNDMSYFSDPGHVMSADEIEALIANM